MDSVTPERMEKSIAEGRQRTAMKAWGTILKPEEVKEIIKYIKSFMKAKD